MTSTPLQRTVVPPRHGRAVALAAGQRVRVIDIEGGQVGDVFAFVSGARDEYHSAAHTRAHVNRLFPALGEPFVTNLRRPVLTLVEDTSPGHHDMLIPAHVKIWDEEGNYAVLEYSTAPNGRRLYVEPYVDDVSWVSVEAWIDAVI